MIGGNMAHQMKAGLLAGVLMAVLMVPARAAEADKAVATEAFNILGMLLRKVSECVAMSPAADMTGCNEPKDLADATGFVLIPSTENFNYTFPYPVKDACLRTDCAARAELRSDPASTIILRLNAETGAVSREATGVFAETTQ
jgi:hypothetical protein